MVKQNMLIHESQNRSTEAYFLDVYCSEDMYSNVLVVFFWSIASCNTYPYVSFMGLTLANHSYVDLSLVGDDSSGSDSVQYHSDLSACCSGSQGPHRGDWYFPDGTRLPFPGDGDVYESRGDQRVDLRHIGNVTSDGIYRCDIPTIAVHGPNYENSVRESVYVGLYSGSGGKKHLTQDAKQLPTYTMFCREHFSCK